MFLLILIIFAIIIFFIVKPMILKPDTAVLFVGGLGSGKSLISVKKSLQLLRRNRSRVKWYNRFHKIKRPRPLLYSTIPIRISRKEYSIPLDDLTPVLASKVVPRSVVFFDEVSLWLDQMTIKPANAQSIEEFCTLFRHYSQGGYIVMNTQNTSKVNFRIRYCLNRAYHLAEFHKFWHIYWVKCRDLSLIDDEKSVNLGSLTDSYKTLFGWIPFRRCYDTYCYSGRVSSTPVQPDTPFFKLKSNRIARAPKEVISPVLDTSDNP